MKLQLFLLYLGSYLCGAIPFGVIIAKLRGIDLIAVGSGNIGATNVKRALGWKFALFVFVLDVSKAAAPCWVARLVVTHQMHGVPAQMFWFLAGLIAVFGHCVSPFLGFKGGKGVSTALGMVVGSAPPVAAACFGLFLVLLFVTRYMSFASLIGVSASIIFGWVIPGQARELVPLYVLLSLFVAYRHRKNISRLMDGTEPKFNFRDRTEKLNDDEKLPPTEREKKSDDEQPVRDSPEPHHLPE